MSCFIVFIYAMCILNCYIIVVGQQKIDLLMKVDEKIYKEGFQDSYLTRPLLNVLLLLLFCCCLLILKLK